MNFFGRELNVYKANLHTHTTNSDSVFSPQETIKLYADQGYDVLAFTDHRTTNPVSTYDGMGMTLISGMEMHPMGPRNISWHLVALNVPENFTHDFETGQEAIDAANAAGGMVFCAHPYWCGLRTDEVMMLKGLIGLEVFNASCLDNGREYDMIHWDELLDMGYRYSAFAVDDIHIMDHFHGGWTNILAKDKSLPSLLQALKNGDCYSSMGPEIYKLSFENGIFEAEFSPCTRAVLYSNQYHGYSRTPFYYKKENNEVISSWQIDLSHEKDCYLRLQITDERGRHAWSNPIYL